MFNFLTNKEMQNHIEIFNLKEVPFEEYNACQKQKCQYVNGALRRAATCADCDWNNLEYKLLKNGKGFSEEYMVLISATKIRWISISSLSLFKCLTALVDNML